MELTIDDIRREAVDEGLVHEALTHMGEVYESLPPFRRKELIRLVLDRAEVSESQLRLAFRGRPSANESRSETSKWLRVEVEYAPVYAGKHILSPPSWREEYFPKDGGDP